MSRKIVSKQKIEECFRNGMKGKEIHEKFGYPMGSIYRFNPNKKSRANNFRYVDETPEEVKKINKKHASSRLSENNTGGPKETKRAKSPTASNTISEKDFEHLAVFKSTARGY